MSHKKLFFFKALILFLCIQLTSSCSSSSKGTAPKQIGNLKVTLLYNKVTEDFKHYLGKEVVYTFYKNLTYEVNIDNKPFSNGKYVFFKTSPSTAELTLTYQSKDGLVDQVLHLYFKTSNEGDFEAIPYPKRPDTESGTFSTKHFNSK
jgi:hypothetical protein